jgi:1-acyl-sn-glycerol-3-phosphate acyltransferase
MTARAQPAERDLLLPNQKPPVIYIANHSNWWDGLLVYDAYLARSTYKHYIMMDEKQLSQFRFFSRAGAFSIDKSRPSGVVESLQYAAELLRMRQAVWIFPQGDIVHLEKRPLQFFSGVSYLLHQCPDAVVVPVTLYYSFAFKQKPEASLWFGAPVAEAWGQMERREMTETLRQVLERQLDAHRDLYMENGPSEAPQFVPILRARTTDEWFVIFKKWVRRWLRRSS